MRLYVGIKRNNDYYYIAVLNNQGVAVLKAQFPIDAPTEGIIKSLSYLKDAFQAHLGIAICREYSIDLSFIDAIEEAHGPVKLVDPTTLHSTDFLTENPFSPDYYRYPIQLAILKSLDE